jgi:hypothetical protein
VPAQFDLASGSCNAFDFAFAFAFAFAKYARRFLADLQVGSNHRREMRTARCRLLGVLHAATPSGERACGLSRFIPNQLAAR